MLKSIIKAIATPERLSGYTADEIAANYAIDKARFNLP